MRLARRCAALFTTTDRFGKWPYDGFWFYAYHPLRPDFIQQHQDKIVPFQPVRHQRQTKRQALWRHSLSLPIAGRENALKFFWDPLDPWEGMPYLRGYFNPSRTGYDAQQTYELMLTALDAPLSALMATLDTKVDLLGNYWWVAAHIYYPYARYIGHADWLPDLGTVYEGKWTRVNMYAKAGDHDTWLDQFNRREWEEIEAPITRVEIRQRFVKPRPTFGDFLRGAQVEKNKLRYLKVVEDLDQLGDRVLAAEAHERYGLTRALRQYGEFANVTKADVEAMKELINAIATREIYDLYRPQAEAWHATFRG